MASNLSDTLHTKTVLRICLSMMVQSVVQMNLPKESRNVCRRKPYDNNKYVISINAFVIMSETWQ